jgi:hypothetical protein
MLLTKETDYKVNARSLKYYKNLGYQCHIGDIISVKVEDLKPFSLSLVQYQCDRCGKVFELPFRSFSHSHRINEKTFCVECANKNKYEAKSQESEKYKAKDGFKICSSCNRKLPANSDYFNHKGIKLSDERKHAISLRNKGKWSGNKNPRVTNPFKGKDNPNWRGGITALYQELRSDTKEWLIKSAESTNYNCVITGKNFDNVHHLYSFKNIVEEVFVNLNIDKRKNVSEYSECEEIAIRNELKRLHNFYGYGSPINKDVHKLFHDLYGYTNTNYCDFIEFVKRVELGEFDKWFEENNLPININYDYISYVKELQKEVG